MSDGMRDMLHDAALRIFADQPSDLWAVSLGRRLTRHNG